MTVLISKNADIRLVNTFHDVILVDKTAPVYDAVSCHPDIYYCRLPNGSVIKAQTNEIGNSYPENIGFNAVCLDKYFIHNLKYTNPRLRQCAENLGLVPVNVKQGYTKCSCVIVDGSSIITSDNGIYRTLSALDDVNVLKIRQGYVHLKGFEYGFLGGTSGRVGETLYFSGDITKHPDFETIRAFCEKRNTDIKWFDFPLDDIGSIIEYDAYYKKVT